MSSRRAGQLSHRLTISVDSQFIESLKIYMKARGHLGVSEAIRDIARGAFLEVEITVLEDEKCFAALSYTYDFKTRNLANRISQIFADSELVVSILKNHSSANHVVEVVLLSGTRRNVELLARSIFGERGVRNGQLNLFPI
jgi:CopG family nickel-responsive transcriptional regulator